MRILRDIYIKTAETFKSERLFLMHADGYVHTWRNTRSSGERGERSNRGRGARCERVARSKQKKTTSWFVFFFGQTNEQLRWQ